MLEKTDVSVIENSNKAIQQLDASIQSATKSISNMNAALKANSDAVKEGATYFALLALTVEGTKIAFEQLGKIDLSTSLGQLGEGFSQVGSGVESGLGKVSAGIEKFGTGFDNAGASISSGMGKISEGITQIGASGESAGAALGNGITSIGTGVGNLGSGISLVGKGFTDVGSGIDSISGSLTALSTALPAVGAGFLSMCTSISDVMSYIPQIAIFGGALYGLSLIGEDLLPASDALVNIGAGMNSVASAVSSFGSSLDVVAASTMTLISLLPMLGTSIMNMAVNMSGLVAYLPTLITFVLFLGILALMGEGLMSAGIGMQNIGLGLLSMTEGMAALITFMPIFIESLAGITENIVGIILFVLLAVAMFLMAVAIQTINEHIVLFTESLTTITQLMSVGFVAAFAVFAIMLIAMSFFMEKVAKGMDKITDSMSKQIAKLAILNPLMAAYAILSNPFMGVATVALAIAGGLLVKALLPAMATGGIVSEPTIAMVGEGRYPEAVVPLGGSPQFSSMKSDIANAVIQGLHFANLSNDGKSSQNQTINLNIDGQSFARLVMPELQKECTRNGYKLAMKGA